VVASSLYSRSSSAVESGWDLCEKVYEGRQTRRWHCEMRRCSSSRRAAVKYGLKGRHGESELLLHHRWLLNDWLSSNEQEGGTAATALNITISYISSCRYPEETAGWSRMMQKKKKKKKFGGEDCSFAAIMYRV
jgi:hypothetical protein